MEFLKRQIDQEIFLDEYLTGLHFPRKDIHLLKMEKRIRLNKKVVTGNLLLQPDDILEINVLKQEDNNLQPLNEPLDVLYEDDYLLVVNKPTGIIIHDDGVTERTLDGIVANYYLENGQRHPVYHVHRLDKETSGVILYCKQTYLLGILDYQLAHKEIKREYLALVMGRMRTPITIDKPIGKDRHTNNKYRISETGKAAITHIEPLQTHKNTTLVKCQLETGRTHQIRVHLASISHPIVGDELYGGCWHERIMLHSYCL